MKNVAASGERWARHPNVPYVLFSLLTKRLQAGPYIIIFLSGPRFIPSTWGLVPAPLNPLPGTLLSNSTTHKNM